MLLGLLSCSRACCLCLGTPSGQCWGYVRRACSDAAPSESGTCMLKALVLLQQMSSAAVHRVLHRKAVILACVSPCAWSAWSAAVDIHHCAGTSEVPAGHDAGVGHHSTAQNKVRASRDDGMLVMLTPCMLLTCSAAASFATGGTCDLFWTFAGHR